MSESGCGLPIQYYLSGVLEPLDRYDEDAEAVDVSEFNKHDDAEDDLATSSIAQEENRPMRTIGLTVRPKEDAVQVHLSWAEYTLEDDEWIREPHELDHNISLQNVSEAGGRGSFWIIRIMVSESWQNAQNVMMGRGC